MKITMQAARESVTYVPFYGGNRELSAEEQMTAEIHLLTHKEIRAYARQMKKWPKSRGVRDMNDERNMADNYDVVQAKQFRENVGQITNLEINGEEITTGEQLYDHEAAPWDLVRELIQAMEDVSLLNEGDIKNFKSQSVSAA